MSSRLCAYIAIAALHRAFKHSLQPAADTANTTTAATTALAFDARRKPHIRFTDWTGGAVLASLLEPLTQAAVTVFMPAAQLYSVLTIAADVRTTSSLASGVSWRVTFEVLLADRAYCCCCCCTWQYWFKAQINVCHALHKAGHISLVQQISLAHQ
jgi:hypothetical protein